MDKIMLAFENAMMPLILVVNLGAFLILPLLIFIHHLSFLKYLIKYDQGAIQPKKIITLSFVWLVMGFLSLGIIVPAIVMSYDSSGSINSIFTNLFTTSLSSFPILCLLGFIFVLLLSHRKEYRAALLSSYFPFIAILYIIVSIVLLQIFCKGSFTCN